MPPTLKSYVGIGLPGPRGPAGPAGGLGFENRDQLEARVVELVGQNAPAAEIVEEVMAAVATLESSVVKTINGQAPVNGNISVSGTGGAPVTAPASTSLVLDVAMRTYAPLTITGPTTLTLSGDVPGANVRMDLVADGVNTPVIVGGSQLNASFGYLPTAGTVNLFQAEHTGGRRVYAWSQLEVNNPSTPAPPAPTPPAPAPSPVAPSAPTNFVAGASGSTTQGLSWAAPATGFPASYTYAIAHRVSGSGAFPSPQITGLMGTSTTVTGLPSATAHDYQITATNTTGTGPAATVSNVSTAAAPTGGEDAMTADYRTRMATAGRTPNETHVAAADTFAKALRSAGIHTKFTAVNLAIGDVLADSLVPFIGGTNATTYNTVSFDPTLGWMTNGSSAVITGVQALAGNWGMGAYLRTTQATENVARGLMGTGTAADAYRIVGNRTPGLGSAGAANGHVSNLHGTLVGHAGVTSGGMVAGAWTEVRRSTSNTELFFNGASVNLSTATTITGAADVPVGAPVALMALNASPGNVPASFLAANTRTAGYWFTDGTITPADMQAFYTALQAFQTAMGRQV